MSGAPRIDPWPLAPLLAVAGGDLVYALSRMVGVSRGFRATDGIGYALAFLAALALSLLAAPVLGAIRGGRRGALVAFLAGLALTGLVLVEFHAVGRYEAARAEAERARSTE